ncbi:MAG: phosphotransferase [Bacteroidetes bacterium]|nr:phosphotransferase [Bacteroidota bacterium]
MKKSKLSLTDIHLLRDLFAPGLELILIDPHGRINDVDVSSGKVVFPEDNLVNFVVDVTNPVFSCFLSNAQENLSTVFDFINNADGSIRWFYQAGSKDASHLSLYNSNSWKSKIYVSVSRLAWKLGQSNLLASGQFEMQQLLVDEVKAKYGILTNEKCSFFTGTRGATRKVVVDVQCVDGTNEFIKIPLTKTAERLIKNEIDMVKSLNKFDFTTLSLPKISKHINGHARLSNVKPAITIPANKIAAIHATAVGELCALSHERKSIADTEAWEVTISNIHYLFNELVCCNNLDQQKIQNLVKGLKELYSTISIVESIPVSVSHGDFTPWNMYCDEQRLYVYDWEMARNGIPMLFDLFHFSYQSVILQQQKSYVDVRENINVWLKQPVVMHMIQKYRINVQLHHALYLLFNVSFYLRQYLNEKEPLIQSEWMMDAWTMAIDECLSAVNMNRSNDEST